MRRLLTLLICLTMLIPALPATAEAAEQRLVIAITSEESAQNLPIEEAFFKANPGVTIEYRLYSTNQLNSLLMTNQTDFDMIITEYAGLIDMAEKDYLLTLDQIGLEAYPAELLDMSELLMYNEKLFALPISIGQEAWFIHYELSEQNNIEYPAKDGAWTWEEYLEFSKRFPILFGKNREKSLYMMTGASLLDYPALQNVQVDMFLNYLALYPNEINRFFTDYFPTFRQVLKSDALMPRKLDESGILRENRTNDVLMVITSADNPIGMMQSFMAREGYLGTLALMHDPNLTFSGGPTEEEIVRNSAVAEQLDAAARAGVRQERCALFGLHDRLRYYEERTPQGNGGEIHRSNVLRRSAGHGRRHGRNCVYRTRMPQSADS